MSVECVTLEHAMYTAFGNSVTLTSRISKSSPVLIPPTCVHHRSRHDAVPDRRSHRHPSIIPTRSLVAQGSCVESARTRSSVPAPESCCRSRLGAVQVLVCSIPVSNLSFSSSLAFYFTATHRRFEAHNASHDLSRPDRWWYEVIETFRRLTMTALLLLFKARQHQHHGKPKNILEIRTTTHAFRTTLFAWRLQPSSPSCRSCCTSPRSPTWTQRLTL